MTVPSTEELHRLLNEATPGEWRMYADTDLPKIYGVQTTAGEPICIDGTPQDCQIIQFTRVLAAEVIRLRQGINDLKKAHVDALNHPVGDGSLYFHSNAIFELSRILEGDEE